MAYTDVFNQVCATGDNVDSRNGGGYALAKMTAHELVGFLDPSSDQIPDQQMQANSSLLFWERKECIADLPTPEQQVNGTSKKKG